MRIEIGQIIKTNMEYINKIVQGEALAVLKEMEPESVDCVITSPPYWALRDYGVVGQIGAEGSVEEYIDRLCLIFDEVKRVLKPTGTVWVNLGDTYNRSQIHGDKKFGNEEFNKNRPSRERTKTPAKAKQSFKDYSLLLIPSRFAIEMCKRGWILRNEIIWHKPNAMPSSAKNRFTVDFEKIYFFVKSPEYYFLTQREPHKPQSIRRAARAQYSAGKPYAMQESQDYKGYENLEERLKSGELRSKVHPDGRNKRTTWFINTKSERGAHYAKFPDTLVETPLKAGCPKGGVVLDPFIGSGTTAVVAKKLGMKYIGIDISNEYVKMARRKLYKEING